MSTPISTFKNIALFPGQGAQHVGMGKDLFEQFAIAKEVFEEVSDAIRFNLKKLCFDGPESDLNLTENTQPALLAHSVASFRVAQKEFGYQPSLAAGHSLGEYSALVCLGAFPLASAAAWVRTRGQTMQSAVPKGEGSMAAILNLENEKVDLLCKEATRMAVEKRATPTENTPSVNALVEPANFNSPGQVVIAGSVDALQEAIQLVKSDANFKGGRAMPLAVSAPFHCSLMAPAKAKMREVFQSAKPQEHPRSLLCPYLPNRTARLNQEPGIIFDLLIDQVDQPVLWSQSMAQVFQMGLEWGVEFGPGKVLQGLAKRNLPQGLAFTTLSVGDSGGIQELEKRVK